MAAQSAQDPAVAAAPQAASPYVKLVLQLAVDECLALTFGNFALTDSTVLDRLEMIGPPRQEMVRRTQPGRVEPQMAQTTIQGGTIGIRFDPGLSCMVYFDGPQRDEARARLVEVMNSSAGDFSSIPTRHSVQNFTDEASYRRTIGTNAVVQYDIGTRPESNEPVATSIIMWMPWIEL